MGRKSGADVPLGLPHQSSLKKLFLFATAETHFLLYGNFYDQTDSEAMGSPLAPVLPNLFMGHHGKDWL